MTGSCNLFKYFAPEFPFIPPILNANFCRSWQMLFIFRLWQILRSMTGEGNGSPLQYYCLENLVDGGAWWAAVHRVAQSRTQLKQLSSSSGGQWHGSLLGLPVRCVFPRVGNRASVSGKLSGCWLSQVKGWVLCKALATKQYWKISRWADSTKWEKILFLISKQANRNDFVGGIGRRKNTLAKASQLWPEHIVFGLTGTLNFGYVNYSVECMGLAKRYTCEMITL